MRNHQVFPEVGMGNQIMTSGLGVYVTWSDTDL